MDYIQELKNEMIENNYKRHHKGDCIFWNIQGAGDRLEFDFCGIFCEFTLLQDCNFGSLELTKYNPDRFSADTITIRKMTAGAVVEYLTTHTTKIKRAFLNLN